MVRCIPPVCSAADTGKCATDQIVYHCNPLRRETKACIREQNVIVDQCRTVADLHKNILRHHASFERFGKCRTLIIMEQVLRKSCSLCFPVTPDSHRAVMNMIAAHRHIDCRMHLDSGNFCSPLLHHVVDMVNVVVLDHTEHTAHPANDSTLFAVMNVVPSNNVASDVFLQPPVVLSPADRIPLHLRRAFHLLIRKVVIIVRIQILAKRNSGALAVCDLAVLNDPALAPVRADHAILKCCRRRPRRCRFLDLKSTDRQIADAGL